MQTKVFNAYRITHENGSVEDINALDLVQALENMEIPETESSVVQTFLIKKGIKTLIEDEKAEVMFSTVVSDNAGGSIATPASGRIHTGDQIALKAIPAKNYAFVSWALNGITISKEASLNFIMPPLPKGLNTAVFTANFKLANVEWTTEVSPAGAGSAGCIAFPSSGSIEANGTLELLAVAKDGYTFQHWERNGEVLTENELATIAVTPLAEGEDTCVYKAVFSNNM